MAVRAVSAPRTSQDDAFDAFLSAVQKRSAAVLARKDVHLFSAGRPADASASPGTPPSPDASPSPDTPPSPAPSELFARFLDALPPADRQWHNCSACRKFMRRYGGLVTLDARGRSESLLWSLPPDRVPAPYAAAVRALADAIMAAPIERVFLTQQPVWGQPEAGSWSHLSLTPPPSALARASLLKTPGQAMAEKLEEHKMLRRSLAEFPRELVQQAHTLLTGERLLRAEKCVEIAGWLLDLHQRLAQAGSDQTRDNLIWLAVAQAPPGYCHVRSGMIGTLLEDLQQGLPFAEVKRRFDAKMHPLQYMRPTAAPSAGNIAQAEAIIAKLNAAGALERRFALLADVDALWRPAQPPQNPAGVFAHLQQASAPKPKPSIDSAQRSAAPSIDVPPVAMTWTKFRQTVLPTAEQIEYLAVDRPDSYAALVTAQNPDAPPIIQWDSAERRNPVTWYVYVNGTPPSRWNLTAGAHHRVTAIALSPHRWHGATGFAHFGEGVIFLLQGAKDVTYQSSGGFFPEFLRSELHPVRKTLEAYAKTAVIAGKDEAEGCGICLTKGGKWSHTFRVTAQGGARLSYTLDRWD